MLAKLPLAFYIGGITNTQMEADVSETFTPPIDSIDGLPPTSESPCQSDGGFCYAELEAAASGLPYTPVDEANGVPFPIHPESTFKDSKRFPSDEHHPWHPRKQLVAADGILGSRALRYSRVQLVNYDLHHVHYHGHFHGPEIPQDEADLFRSVVLTAAGYIPEFALAFDKGREPVLKQLAPELRMRLWQKGHIRVAKHSEVQRYLRDYTYRQDLSDVNESTIEEFLFTKDPAKRWELGNDLIGRAVYQATYPIKDVYRTAHKTEKIPPDRARAVSRFVLSSLSMRRHRTMVFDELSSRLIKAAA